MSSRSVVNFTFNFVFCNSTVHVAMTQASSPTHPVGEGGGGGAHTCIQVTTNEKQLLVELNITTSPQHGGPGLLGMEMFLETCLISIILWTKLKSLCVCRQRLYKETQYNNCSIDV